MPTMVSFFYLTTERRMQNYQHFIHKSRYSRYIDKLKRREHWHETVDRYIKFICSNIKTKFDYDIDNELKAELRRYILEMRVMPSMRAMMTAGPAAERQNMAAFNCSYLPIDDIKCFDELMYILLCGTGVGFSIESSYTNKLPEVPDQLFQSDTTIVVADSKEGWAKSLRQLISLLYAGEIPKFDFSKVRPAGARLKTFGGRASGPKPLNELFNFVTGVFRASVGRRLHPIECHDICCKIAEVVVVGGVRRSALISLSDLSDARMSHAKSGAWWETNGQRSLANNSAVYKEKPSMSEFMREWQSLYESKSGERGIFNRDATNRQVAKNGRRNGDHVFGTNPCLSPDSMIETIKGRIKIKDITEPTMVYSMDNDGKLCIKPCSASWISKKNAQTIKIKISSEHEVVCTPDHKIYIEGRGWIEAQDIHIGDRVVHLSRNRRGACYSGVKLTTQDKNDYVMEHRLVYESYYGAIPDGYDIHHIDGDTYNNNIDNLECLSHSDHAKISALEQPNDHMIYGYHGKGISGYGFISPPNSKFGAKKIVPIPEELKSNLHQYANVVSITEGPITDVYDLTVEDTHNFIADFVVVHNCSEIILRPYEVCNLTEVIVRSEDKVEDLKAKMRIATILGTFQSTLTDFPYLRKIWQKNAEEERLLGVSLTGIYDNKITYRDNNDLEGLLLELKQIAVETNKIWAGRLGINPSAAITAVKPSGTVSSLCDTASGIHTRHAEYYIRTVRSDVKDPLTNFLIDIGIPYEHCVMRPDSTIVFSFPMKAPEGAMTRKDISAIEHLGLWLTYQRYYCEHKPSITISVKEDEWMLVGAWVWDHFDEVTGISFLPYSDYNYKQAPYTECTKEEYEAALAVMPPDIDWEQFIETDDNVEGAQTLACVGGICEL